MSSPALTLGSPILSSLLNALKLAKSLFHINSECFSKGPSALGCGAGESVWEPIRSCFSVCHILKGLMSISLIDLQSQMFWGLIAQVLVLKVRAPDVRFKPLPSQGEPLCFEFPPDCGSPCLGVGFMGRLCLSLSYSLPCSFPFVCTM